MYAMAYNKLHDFVFMPHSAVQKVQFFVFMGIAQLHAEMTWFFFTN